MSCWKEEVFWHILLQDDENPTNTMRTSTYFCTLQYVLSVSALTAEILLASIRRE
jgi:hypothetical protein